MKKQSGFTLIELMVVMAIIAILATAGLSAYTGYIKKARDTTRIADVAAINNIVTGMMSSTGKPPQTTNEVYLAVVAANNNVGLFDPLASQADGSSAKSVCLDNGAADDGVSPEADELCFYTYRVCDAGAGFAVGTRFESASNIKMYADDPISGTAGTVDYLDNSIFEIGSCQAPCTAASTPAGCPVGGPAGSTGTVEILPTQIKTGTAAALGADD